MLTLTDRSPNIALAYRRTVRQAERERKRENEIRAFRDFSINLSSSATPSAAVGRSGGGGFHDDDGPDFPRGPPKRAEYKAAGVSLDVLKDNSVSPESCEFLQI